jgi:hypothetical protein
MVAFAMTETAAAEIVRSTDSVLEAAERFHLFLKLYGIVEPKDVMRFGDKCELVLACVKISNESEEPAKEDL